MHIVMVFSCATLQIQGDVTNQFKVLLEVMNIHICEYVKRVFRWWIVR